MSSSLILLRKPATMSGIVSDSSDAGFSCKVLPKLLPLPDFWKDLCMFGRAAWGATAITEGVASKMTLGGDGRSWGCSRKSAFSKASVCLWS